MDTEPGECAYEVKTIKWREPDNATSVSLMMVKFVAGGNQALQDSGYAGENILFCQIDPGALTFHWKPRVFSNNCGALEIKEFILGLYSYNRDIGPLDWEGVEDGETYGPDLYE